MLSGETNKSGTLRAAILFLAISLILLFIYHFLDVFIIFVVSFLLSAIFNPIVNFLETRGVKRIFGTLFLFICFGGALFLSGFYLLPKIQEQLSRLAGLFSEFSISDQLQILELEINKIFPFIQEGTISHKVEEIISGFFIKSIDHVSAILTSLVSIAAILVIVPFITFFLIKDNKTILKGIINAAPNKYFEMSYYIVEKVNRQLGRFVRGWIIDAFLVGLLCGVGLSILGVDSAITIGVVAGVGHLIPYFGPIIGGIPAILVSIAQFGDFSMIPSIILMFTLVYTVDNGFFQPHIFSKSVDMHPIVIILLIITGGQILGALGMLLAVPTATVMKTAVKEIYIGYKNFKIIKS